MNGKYLLDTNIVIACFAREETVLEALNRASEIFIPSIVFGELYYGARKSTRVTENVRQVDEFLATSAVLDCDVETAQRFGIIKAELRRKGKPIPENDIWIAAVAHQHQLTLVTRDAHFSEIPHLSIQTW